MRPGDGAIYKTFLPKNAKYKTLISQSTDVDIDEGVEEQQETNMGYAVANKDTLVEKQQRHFNQRLTNICRDLECKLNKKHTSERMVLTTELDYDAFQKDWETVSAAKRQAEDIIMVGDPVKMLEAVNAFQNITIH